MLLPDALWALTSCLITGSLGQAGPMYRKACRTDGLQSVSADVLSRGENVSDRVIWSLAGACIATSGIARERKSVVTSQATAARGDKARSHDAKTVRFIAVAIGVLGAVIAFIVLRYGANVQLLVKTKPDGQVARVTLVSAIVMSAVAGLAGWAVLGLLERFTGHPYKNWLIISIAVLVVSLAGPMLAGQTAAAKFSLAALHLAVAGAVIPWLARSASDAPQRSGGRGWPGDS